MTTENDKSRLDRDWSNYWQGRTAAEQGSALVGIENHPSIRQFWDEQLGDLDRTGRAVDLACGAGTVAKVLTELGFKNIWGLDISEAAIDVMSNTLPDVIGVINPADATGFEDRFFDLVVSQFGFEYGDFRDVIPEIARITADNGRFIALSHKTGGGIHAEVSDQLNEFEAIKNTEFIDTAKILFTAAMTKGSDKSVEEISEIFRPAQKKLLALVETYKGMAQHLYVSTQRMYRFRHTYVYQDIMDWFDGMENEIDRFIGRMRSMKNAAIDDEKRTEMIQLFKSNGFEMDANFILPDTNGLDLGWIFQGRKIN